MRWFVATMLGLAGCATGGLPTDRLPVSTSGAEIPGSEAVVVATAGEVTLDGKRIASVKAVLGGSNPVVQPLYDGLIRKAGQIAARAASDPGAPAFRGALGLQVDKDLPAELLIRIVDTAGQASFGLPWVVVTDGDRGRYGIKLTLPSVAAAGVKSAEASGEVVHGGYANPRVEVLPDRGYVVHARDRVVDPGQGLVLPCTPAPCTSGWPVLDLTRLARRIKLDHPRDRAVVVAPAPQATVQTTVTALDATRTDALAGRGTHELFPDALLGTGVK